MAHLASAVGNAAFARLAAGNQLAREGLPWGEWAAAGTAAPKATADDYSRARDLAGGTGQEMPDISRKGKAAVALADAVNQALTGPGGRDGARAMAQNAAAVAFAAADAGKEFTPLSASKVKGIGTAAAKVKAAKAAAEIMGAPPEVAEALGHTADALDPREAIVKEGAAAYVDLGTAALKAAAGDTRAAKQQLVDDLERRQNTSGLTQSASWVPDLLIGGQQGADLEKRMADEKQDMGVFANSGRTWGKWAADPSTLEREVLLGGEHVLDYFYENSAEQIASDAWDKAGSAAAKSAKYMPGYETAEGVYNFGVDVYNEGVVEAVSDRHERAVDWGAKKIESVADVGGKAVDAGARQVASGVDTVDTLVRGSGRARQRPSSEAMVEGKLFDHLNRTSGRGIPAAWGPRRCYDEAVKLGLLSSAQRARWEMEHP